MMIDIGISHGSGSAVSDIDDPARIDRIGFQAVKDRSHILTQHHLKIIAEHLCQQRIFIAAGIEPYACDSVFRQRMRKIAPQICIGSGFIHRIIQFLTDKHRNRRKFRFLVLVIFLVFFRNRKRQNSGDLRFISCIDPFFRPAVR